MLAVKKGREVRQNFKTFGRQHTENDGTVLFLNQAALNSSDFFPEHLTPLPLIDAVSP